MLYLSMLLLVFGLWFLIFAPPAHATGEFTLHQKTIYTINPNGSGSASTNTKLINNYSEIYAKEYQIDLSGNNLKNIVGHDELGNIISSVDHQIDSTSIHLKFNQPQLGKNKETNFTVSYSIDALAVHKGSTWEISLPQLKNISDYQEINLILILPSSFGGLAYASVPVRNQSILGENQQIILNKSDIENKKILLVFGNYQLFNFNLTYALTNTSASVTTTQIALPPDTNNQRVTYSSLQPQPNDITVDTDGNWLASYTLMPLERKNITATGQVKITPTNLDVSPPPSNIATLTSAQEFWPTTDPKINNIISTVRTPRQIYDYVVNTLSYDYTKIDNAKRVGALAALQNPQNSLCTEFTDLFVTLARANGIPAREIEGFAYTNNSKIKPTNLNTDILHAWPQFFDRKTQKWISVDPTWGKTTNGIDFFNDLDLNHFTFVIHGVDSQYPPPPGSYKTDNTKSVNVDLATQEINVDIRPPQISFDKSFPPKLILYNQNLGSLRNFHLTSTSINFNQTFNLLPPYSKIELSYRQLPFLQALLPRSSNITFSTSGDHQNPSAINVPYPYHFIYLLSTIGLAIISLSLGGIIMTKL